MPPKKNKQEVPTLVKENIAQTQPAKFPVRNKKDQYVAKPKKPDQLPIRLKTVQSTDAKKEVRALKIIKSIQPGDIELFNQASKQADKSEVKILSVPRPDINPPVRREVTPTGRKKSINRKSDQPPVGPISPTNHAVMPKQPKQMHSPAVTKNNIPRAARQPTINKDVLVMTKLNGAGKHVAEVKVIEPAKDISKMQFVEKKHPRRTSIPDAYGTSYEQVPTEDPSNALDPATANGPSSDTYTWSPVEPYDDSEYARENEFLDIARLEVGLPVVPGFNAPHLPPVHIQEIPESISPVIFDQDVAPIFVEIPQRIEKLEPVKFEQVEELLDTLADILDEAPAIPDCTLPVRTLHVPDDINVSETDSPIGSQNTPIPETEKLITEVGKLERLEIVITEILETIGMEVDEPQVRQIARILVKENISSKQQSNQHLAGKGTHEVLSIITGLIDEMRQRLESLHTLLGRIVLAAQREIETELRLAA